VCLTHEVVRVFATPGNDISVYKHHLTN
jgi:hypothetical protein